VEQVGGAGLTLHEAVLGGQDEIVAREVLRMAEWNFKSDRLSLLFSAPVHRL
jgi:hypothetical protein